MEEERTKERFPETVKIRYSLNEIPKTVDFIFTFADCYGIYVKGGALELTVSYSEFFEFVRWIDSLFADGRAICRKFTLMCDCYNHVITFIDHGDEIGIVGEDIDMLIPKASFFNITVRQFTKRMYILVHEAGYVCRWLLKDVDSCFEA